METDKKRIFIVEDEADIARLLAEALERYGFATDHYRSGGACLQALRNASPALCLVDLGLPDMDGMELVRTLQENHDCAVIILSGRGELSERILGLELGADDYLVKPVDPRELVARVRSVLRRWAPPKAADTTSAPPRARFAGWLFDSGRLSLTDPEGRTVSLSAAEAALLEALLRNPNRILGREQLLPDKDAVPFDRSIDVRMSRLRRKLEEDPQNPRLIKTVYGAGYLFTAAVEWH